MKTNKSKENHLKKTVLVAALIIGSSTLTFQGLTQATAAAEYNKTDTIPTSYATCAKVTSQASVPEGYTKANYTVGSIDLIYYTSQTPTATDLTKEKAAELAAQYLWQVYGVNLDGQTIEMGYHTATDNTPRPTWTADIKMKNQDYHDGYRVDGYEVEIDSVTGEIFNIGMGRTLKEKVHAGPDSSIDQSESGEFAQAAKSIAKKYDIVHSDIESIKCTGQGASFPTNADDTYGDPDISFEIHGTNGEAALMTISRYDKACAGVMFNGEYKYDLKNHAKIVASIKSKE